MAIKFIDLGDVSPSTGYIAKPRYLGWPVDAYRVTLPYFSGNADDSLNPFERVVLRIIEAERVYDEQALSEITCMPPDLVRSVLLRLRDKGEIDQRNRIASGGSRYGSSRSANIKFRTAWVFRETIGGNVLPYILLPEKQGGVRTKKSPKAKLLSGRRGKRNPITASDVIEAAKGMRRRAQSSGIHVSIPPLNQIRVMEGAESYYLECPIIIQESDADHRIVNPFGGGYSFLLEKEFERLLSEDDGVAEWLIRWREKLSQPQNIIGMNASAEMPIDEKRCSEEYKKLYENLIPRKDNGKRTVDQVYAAIEWALFYTCLRFGFDDQIPRLKFSRQTGRTKMLKEAMEDLGIDAEKSRVPYTDENAIERYLNGRAEMGTVLSVALLQAAENRNHNLRNALELHPDLIDHLLIWTKGSRGSRAHGAEVGYWLDDNSPDVLFMFELIGTLLPDLGYDPERIGTHASSAGVDVRLDAMNRILREFGGFQSFGKLCEVAKERLVNAEGYRLVCADGDNAQPFIMDLCEAVQAQLAARLDGLDEVFCKESEYFKSAIDSASEAGFDEFPEGLQTVGHEFIRQALRGGKPSLGGVLIALLITENGSTLSLMASYCPSLLTDVAQLAEYRAHGNESVPLSIAEVDSFLSKTIRIVKTLTEV